MHIYNRSLVYLT